jgi:hypothetical protein
MVTGQRRRAGNSLDSAVAAPSAKNAKLIYRFPFWGPRNVIGARGRGSCWALLHCERRAV